MRENSGEKWCGDISGNRILPRDVTTDIDGMDDKGELLHVFLLFVTELRTLVATGAMIIVSLYYTVKCLPGSLYREMPESPRRNGKNILLFQHSCNFVVFLDDTGMQSGTP